MTDKEFKRLGRAQLIDIIYQLQLQLDQVNEEKQALESELKDKRLRLQSAGNIAEAALEINDCFRSAQNAAEQYINEIKAIREETEAQRQIILAKARAEASAIISKAAEIRSDYNSAVENISKEIRKNCSDNGSEL
jgi:cell division septum initiation protein DivIVA